MSERIGLYGEEYLSIFNKFLKGHPKYREDMKFTQLHPNGAVVFSTKDDPLCSKEDEKIQNEVCKAVYTKYKYIG